MNNGWIIIYEDGDVMKNAAAIVRDTLSKLVGYPLVCKSETEASHEETSRRKLICIGRSGGTYLRDYEAKGLIKIPDEREGYAIYVGKSVDTDAQTVRIAGRDDAGALYGCAEFCSRYCGGVLFHGSDIWCEDVFDAPYDEPLPEWRVSRFPAVSARAVWTWGHVVYDYRRFFMNMAKLRLNEIVIWNDFAPNNADAVVDFAHTLGIKVIWGFAWGWSTSCREDFENMSEDKLGSLRESIIGRYETEYANIKGDGIYFQSFTEFGADGEKGRRLAETVTRLVNETAGALLSDHPDLHIQFGLHATSVKAHLDVIARVDPRIYIVWEDCGAFPYSYDPEATDGFEETLRLTEKLMRLRGEDERFGAVVKGMLKLDWTRFRHQTGGADIGGRSEAFIKERQKRKDRIWKIIQAGWIKNAGYVQKTLSLIAGGNRPVVEALIEDAMLENRIVFPSALYAELLWTPDADVYALSCEIAKYPFVDFANVGEA